MTPIPKDPAAQAAVDEVLSGRSAPAREKASMAFRATLEAEPTRRTFVPFDSDDLHRAAEVMEELIGVAEGDDVPAAVEEVRRRLPTEELRGLTQYALKLFMTHYPPAREQLRFRPLEQRQPNLVLGARTVEAMTAGAAADSSAAAPPPEGVDVPEAAAAYPSAATPPEDQISFWREDPLLNEHHEHWHLVYPHKVLPLGSRHGELFAYMHEQMIARYDAERLALGLSRVEPYTAYADSIPQGYDPGNLKLWTGDDWTHFGARPAGAHLSDLTGPFHDRPGAKLSDQTGFREALSTAAASGSYTLLTPPQPITIDNLGDTTEANAKSNDDMRRRYGNLHNDGHIHFMAFDNTEPYGVMQDPSTAIRDPIFFRWHKDVDDVFHRFQNTLEPYDFSRAPNAKIRSTDIFLVTATDPSQAAAAAFGGAGWDDEFSAGHAGSIALADELVTEMLTRDIDAVDADGNSIQVPIDYLSHEDFWYVLRVENLAPSPQSVAVRIFIVPEDQLEEREMWIEMDKFVYGLEPDERAVIVRASEESSVVRKPALKPANLTAQDEPDAETEEAAWCDCGWPHTLLLPRGTREGAPYRMLVMLSFGDEITLPPVNGCSSISYCGLEGSDYPDTTEMGYPFNRPFPNGVANALQGRSNIATREFTIRWG